MQASKFLIPTLRDISSDLIPSHKHMIRAGFIKKISSGHYCYLPLGLRVLQKIENIVRNEMNKHGALECQFPLVVPQKLWEQTGRFTHMQKELFQFQDRHKNDYLLSPTHEEPIVEAMKGILNSYKNLPIHLYQITPKFRDEIRPRFGIMRAREFYMKDGYSFHENEQSLHEEYENMKHCYSAIFKRLSLQVFCVKADSGVMGGNLSEEFVMPSRIGEETLLMNDDCSFVDKQENIRSILSTTQSSRQYPQTLKKIHTPDMKKMQDLEEYLKIPLYDMIKCVSLLVNKNYKENEIVLVFLRGDRELNLNKAKKVLNTQNIEIANVTALKKEGFAIGYIGPQKKIKELWDTSIEKREEENQELSWVIGANEENYHYEGYKRDNTPCHDLSLAMEGDRVPPHSKNKDPKEILKQTGAVELGHIFELGDKYSRSLGLQVLQKEGKPMYPLMGCYGIGVSRTMAAIIEQKLSHSDQMTWPLNIAPFQIVMISVHKNEKEFENLQQIYKGLISKNYEVLWDERDSSLGMKFKDAELIGFPIRLILAKKYWQEGVIEIEVPQKEKVIVKANPMTNLQEALDKILYSANSLDA